MTSLLSTVDDIMLVRVLALSPVAASEVSPEVIWVVVLPVVGVTAIP